MFSDARSAENMTLQNITERGEWEKKIFSDHIHPVVENLVSIKSTVCDAESHLDVHPFLCTPMMMYCAQSITFHHQ